MHRVHQSNQPTNQQKAQRGQVLKQKWGKGHLCLGSLSHSRTCSLSLFTPAGQKAYNKSTTDPSGKHRVFPAIASDDPAQ